MSENGHEAWCNRQGKYVTITRDFSDLSSGYYEFTLCDIAIFGEAVSPDIVAVELSSQAHSAYLNQELVFTIAYENQIDDQTTTYMQLANTTDPLASFVSIASF